MIFARVRGMTRRRIIEPGTTWALSRRTTRRYFLLNPDQARELEQCYWYCLGLCAQRFGIVVHAGCLMSSHSHEVVTDVRGVLPRFLQEFHRNSAFVDAGVDCRGQHGLRLGWLDQS